MLKRLSTLRRKKTEEGTAGENGTAGRSGTNGVTGTKAETSPATNGVNGTTSPSPVKKRFSFGAGKKLEAPKEQTQTASREDVDSSLEQFAQLVHASRRPLPTQTGDGSYVSHGDVPSSLFQDIKSLGFKDLGTLREVLQNKGHLQDDKSMLMERVIQLVSSLPANSQNRKDLTGDFLTQLWDSLEHPPMTYLGDKFLYRQPDGSYNNCLFPDWGKAHMPYARSVRPDTLQPGSLPDPGLIFDNLFARNTYREHPNRVSSVLYYWASLIIHDLFQTDHTDYNISQTSSYLDLSTLYGDDEADQNNIRTFKDGKIKPDCFMESRVLGMPPACGVILIMFNRFHNFVVEQLAAINENGRFTKPADNLSPEAAEKAWKKYDHDLFNTGRLITCGLYMNITLLDYLRTIVNLNRSNTTWTLDPRTELGRKVMGEVAAPRGGGNVVSCEFNLVYRWHSSISKKDEEWTNQLYSKLMGKKGEDVSLPELMKGLGMWAKALPADPTKREFAGLKRGADGKFDDGELVDLLSGAIEDVSGCPGAQNVPRALRAAEILGITQARHWGCASLNEFRKFFGLTPHESFESINKNPEIAETLRHLYEHPDFVELYPGLVCEDYKDPMVPGVGICPTYTVSRAILSDAVTLVRSDRFYTIDYTPKALTNWGYTEVQYDFNIEQGCVFYKLFLRAFPNHFKPNSIYAHYPMTVPDENRKIMRSLGREDDYDYERPSLIPQRINLTSFRAAKYLLDRPQEFNVTWGPATGMCMGKGGLDFMLSGDTDFYTKQKKTMAAALYHENWEKQIKNFYQGITRKLIKENSCKLVTGYQVDLTRDVGNIAHVHFASQVFQLPLKTEDNPRGVFTEHELYAIIAIIFASIFFDFEPTKSFPLRMAGKSFGHKLGSIIEANVKATNMTGLLSGIVDKAREYDSALRDYGVHMIRELLKSGMGTYEVAWSQILPTATAMIPNQAQVFTQLMDFYLTPENETHWKEIVKLAQQDSDEAFDKLMHYAMEGIRLNGTFGSYRESTVNATIDDIQRTVSVKPGDRIFCSFVSANRDPERFPDPLTVDPTRPLDSYIHYGMGMHQCLGMNASRVALTSMLKVVASLPGLRRAPGPQGQLKKVPRAGGFYVYLTENHGSYFPFPTTWKLQFDGLPA